MIKKKTSTIIQMFKANGFSRTLELILRRVFNIKVRNYKFYQELFSDKSGIEIGGPSGLFINELPIYKKMKSLDGINFSSFTIWEGELHEGENYNCGDKIGFQYICDAVNLDKIESNKYDFVVSSNNLEHIANPLKALTEWVRIIKPDGLLLLVVPNKDSNFDHNRNVTSFEHMVDDFNNNITEKDLTHLDEILKLHDISMDPLAFNFEYFKERSINNFQNRCLHHHVFDMKLMGNIFKYFNIELLLKNITKKNYIIVGRKFIRK